MKGREGNQFKELSQVMLDRESQIETRLLGNALRQVFREKSLESTISLLEWQEWERNLICVFDLFVHFVAPKLLYISGFILVTCTYNAVQVGFG